MPSEEEIIYFNIFLHKKLSNRIVLTATMYDKNECVEELRKEREHCSFNQEEMTNLIDGGTDKTEFRRKIEQILIKDPEFTDKLGSEYMSHEERYGNDLRKACHLMKKFRDDPELNELLARPDGLRNIGGLNIMGSVTREGNPFQLHAGMFIPTLVSQGTPEQQDRWLMKAFKGEIIGAYAQTEMGHGTFLRGLETTATYDPRTQEFVLNSPTITSSKWWPGGLGKTANYAVVMAQLYTKGKCYGPHNFIAQLRDMDTHESLPGLTIGEIGPRLGMNTNDIGFLRFDNYRIPRTNMLMKHSKLAENGDYVKPISSKLAYGTMVLIRVSLCSYSCSQLQRAVTIATRYAAVRHQSEIIPGEPEPQILDYQTQQYKLIPQIATVFALLFAARNIGNTYKEVTQNISEGKLNLLPELHAVSCGLKALSTTDATRGIETCRLACGGHGYLASSGFPLIYTATTAAMTYEGENTVLLLQNARYLIKSFHAAQAGENVGPSVSYFSSRVSLDVTSSDISNSGLVEAFKKSVLVKVAETESRLQQLFEQGKSHHTAWNETSVLLVKCAEAHTRFFICEQFVKNVETLDVSDELRTILHRLCRLYLVYHVTLNQGDFLRSGALDADAISRLEEEMGTLLSSLRQEAVSIVDAFDLHDFVVHSTLGSWDGNVYERMYKRALTSPLNQKDVPDAYYKYLRPLMKANL